MWIVFTVVVVMRIVDSYFIPATCQGGGKVFSLYYKYRLITLRVVCYVFLKPSPSSSDGPDVCLAPPVYLISFMEKL